MKLDPEETCFEINVVAVAVATYRVRPAVWPTCGPLASRIIHDQVTTSVQILQTVLQYNEAQVLGKVQGNNQLYA